jgi:magnesium chelatase family protein
MAQGKTLSIAVAGVQGHLVGVDAVVDTGPALPSFTLAGVPERSLPETRDRVRAALANCGHPLPQGEITVRLSPPDLLKPGTGTDLAIAAALLAATVVIPAASAERFVHVGELGLDGRLRPVRAVVPAALAAVNAGHPHVVVATGNAPEAALVPGARVHPVDSLSELIALHRGTPPPTPPRPDPGPARDPQPPAGRCDAVGGGLSAGAGGVLQGPGDAIVPPEAGRALEVAAAGGHHLLLIGSPGAGASRLAARLPGLLADLSDGESLEVAAIRSAAGILDPAAGLARRPPFERPLPSASLASLVGGGAGLPRPGTKSLAHRGVLFLEQATEFDTRVLDALAQTLDQGELVIGRADGSFRFPARFQLLLSTGPCPCRTGMTAGVDCTCSLAARRRHLGRLPGPLLDRIDLQIHVPAHAPPGPRSPAPVGLDPLTLTARVTRARAAAAERLKATVWSCNAQVPGSWLRGELRLPPQVTQPADLALERAGLTRRGYLQVLRIAWTLADLAGTPVPDRDDVPRALTLRQSGHRS